MGKVNIAMIRKEREEIGKRMSGNFDSVFWYPEFGKHLMRLLPPYGDGEVPYYHVPLHWGITTTEGKTYPYKCSKPKYGKCPICDNHEALKESKDPMHEERAKEIAIKNTYVYSVLNNKKEYKILTAKPSQHKVILAELEDMLESNIDITDMDTGGIIQLTRYNVDPWASCKTMSHSNVPLSPEIKELVAKEQRDLSLIYIDNTPEELHRAIQGIDVNAEKRKAIYGSSDSTDFDPEKLEQPESAPAGVDSAILSGGTAQWQAANAAQAAQNPPAETQNLPAETTQAPPATTQTLEQQMAQTTASSAATQTPPAETTQAAPSNGALKSRANKLREQLQKE